MPDDDTTTTWDGYSDYQTVSNQIARTIHDAVEAYAVVERRHREAGKMRPDPASKAGSRIMAAAINVQTELAAYEDDNDEYAELLANFEGSDGYVEQLRTVSLRNECPDWLYEFVRDIRRAGFELGYLKAGREDTKRDTQDAESEAREMFADL